MSSNDGLWRLLVTAQREIAQATPQLQRVMELACAHAIALTGADGAAVELLDGEVLACQAAMGADAGRMGERFAVDESPSGPSVRSGQAREHVGAGPPPSDGEPVPSGSTSRFIVPLLVEGRSTGALSVSGASTNGLDATAIDVLEHLAELVAACVEQSLVIEERDRAMVEQRAAVVRLRASEEHHRLVVHNLPGVTVWVYDRYLNVREVRGARPGLAGRADRELVGRALRDFVPPETYPLVSERLLAASAGEAQSFQFRDPRGPVFHVEAAPLGETGRWAGGVLTTWREITAEAADRDAREAAGSQLRAILDHAPDAFVAVDEQGVIQACNLAAEELFGWASGEALQQHVELFVPTAEQDTLLSCWPGGPPATDAALQTQVRHHSGGLIPVEVAIGQVRTPEGIVFTCFVRDITLRTQEEKARAAAEARFRALFERAPVAKALTALDGDERGRLLEVNPAFADLLGFTAAELTGRLATEIIAPDDADELAAVIAQLGRGESELVRLELRYVHRDGHEFPCLVSTSAVTDHDGRSISITQVIDISDSKRAEAELRAAESLFRRAFDDAALGVVLASEDGTILRTNPSFAGLVGYEESELVARPLSSLMHAGTVEPVRLSLAELWSGEIDHLAVEHRWVHASGADLWLAINVTVVRDSDGFPQHFLGQFQDVTDRVRTERALRKADQRFRVAIDHAPIGVIVFELLGPNADRWVHINPAFAGMLGRTEQEIYSSDSMSLIHPDDRRLTIQALRELADGAVDAVEYEKRLIHASGETVWVLVSAAMLPEDRGPSQVVAQVIDISERKRHEAELRRLADHDPLTGLANRRAFQRALDMELSRVGRHGGDGAVLVVDLDGFKAVNDTLGHFAGDQLLSDLAKSLGNTLRTNDTLARIGGDEFALVLPETDQAGAERAADRLLAAVSAHGSVVSSDGSAAVTASVGITTFDGAHTPSSDELLLRADLAMYEAKETGKSRACVYRVPAELAPGSTPPLAA